MPQETDDTLNITELAGKIAAGPGDFDVSGYVALRGSWESFAGSAGAGAPYDDPLGKLYAALAPLGQHTTKKISLDFTRVTGRNIADGAPVLPAVRTYKDVLRAVKLPEDMGRIGAFAFTGCASLDTLVFTGDAPPEIGGDAFAGIKSPLTLEVPAGAEGDYQTLIDILEGGGIEVALAAGT
jgi:hypothetical protein